MCVHSKKKLKHFEYPVATDPSRCDAQVTTRFETDHARKVSEKDHTLQSRTAPNLLLDVPITLLNGKQYQQQFDDSYRERL